ncbi:ribosome small subunit-dependent GTPase A [Parasediminibacterium sp. JCM 36343]|uniref:ribosome small subunit-dependent GTPase A n=1 Tax=Parasediminibacterium sp. JCM 36343 TaxID=3374279 RepID=UPI00397B8CF0
MKALVYKSTGSWYVVKTHEDKTYNARIKGIFKIDGITTTNPLAVGDEVDIEIENELEDTATITHIYPRHNYVARASPRHKHQRHIIASNLDQALIFATLKDPKTSTGFIDRFLVACEMYHLPAIIVFNKSDLYRKKEMDKFLEIKGVYEAIGYPVLLASVMKNTGIGEVKALLQHKTTLLSGHSGVGKSTLINAIFPELSLKTQEVSGWSGKGLHTTTFAEMFDLPTGGKVIDTPGIRELGLADIERHEVSGYFPEMKRLVNDCQFNNCMHFNEQDCAVKDAVNAGSISTERYVSYLNIVDSLKENKWG